MKVVSTPATLHSMIRSLGWSVKKILPLASQVGPSVNEKPLDSRSSLAPGAITLCADASCADAPTNEPARAPAAIATAYVDVFMVNG